jgi:hypothetical protein
VQIIVLIIQLFRCYFFFFLGGGGLERISLLRRDRLTNDSLLRIRQILEIWWEFSGAVHQLFADFKKAMIQLGRKYYTTLK